jgi:hypothetical protein
MMACEPIPDILLFCIDLEVFAASSCSIRSDTPVATAQTCLINEVASLLMKPISFYGQTDKLEKRD